MAAAFSVDGSDLLTAADSFESGLDFDEDDEVVAVDFSGLLDFPIAERSGLFFRDDDLELEAGLLLFPELEPDAAFVADGGWLDFRLDFGAAGGGWKEWVTILKG